MMIKHHQTCTNAENSMQFSAYNIGGSRKLEKRRLQSAEPLLAEARVNTQARS